MRETAFFYAQLVIGTVLIVAASALILWFVLA